MSGYVILAIVLGYIFMMGQTTQKFKGDQSPRIAALAGLFWPLTWALSAVCVPLWIFTALIKNEWW